MDIASKYVEKGLSILRQEIYQVDDDLQLRFGAIEEGMERYAGNKLKCLLNA